MSKTDPHRALHEQLDEWQGRQFEVVAALLLATGLVIGYYWEVIIPLASEDEILQETIEIKERELTDLELRVERKNNEIQREVLRKEREELIELNRSLTEQLRAMRDSGAPDSDIDIALEDAEKRAELLA